MQEIAQPKKKDPGVNLAKMCKTLMEELLIFVKGHKRSLNKWRFMSCHGSEEFIITVLNLARLIWKISTTSSVITT